MRNPIKFTMEDIRADMHKYERGFDISIIPHLNENQEIVDNIHNYDKGQAKSSEANDKAMHNSKR